MPFIVRSQIKTGNRSCSTQTEVLMHDEQSIENQLVHLFSPCLSTV